MSHIRVLVCRVEEEHPEQMTELASFDLAPTAGAPLEPERLLDELEARTHQTGHAILRELLQAQWDLTDEQAAAAQRRRFSP